MSNLTHSLTQPRTLSIKTINRATSQLVGICVASKREHSIGGLDIKIKVATKLEKVITDDANTISTNNDETFVPDKED